MTFRDLTLTGLTADWIWRNVDREAAVATYNLWMANYPVSGSYRPYVMPPGLDVGTWMLDPVFGDFSVLVDMPVGLVQPSEQEWEMALRYESTIAYVKMCENGYSPPPSSGVRNIYTGQIYISGRRRWLAARQAGLETIPVWFSETDMATGSPAWQIKIFGSIHRGAWRLFPQRFKQEASPVDVEIERLCRVVFTNDD